jgi:hypothetical protein
MKSFMKSFPRAFLTLASTLLLFAAGLSRASAGNPKFLDSLGDINVLQWIAFSESADIIQRRRLKSRAIRRISDVLVAHDAESLERDLDFALSVLPAATDQLLMELRFGDGRGNMPFSFEPLESRRLLSALNLEQSSIQLGTNLSPVVAPATAPTVQSPAAPLANQPIANLGSINQPILVSPTGLPVVSNGLVAQTQSSSQVTLSWSNGTANNLSQILVFRSTDNINFTNIATLGPTATSYSDSNLTASQQYFYVLATQTPSSLTSSGVVSTTTAALILPGTGFTGPTVPDPTIQHVDPTQPFSNDLAIANWDVVPNQTFSSLFNVGVVAFHSNGIKEVDFSVNGGAWVKVTSMTLNPQTANTSGVGNQNPGVVEYWATLDASTFAADGQIQVRAVAYPTNGQALVLSPLNLNANGLGTLNQRYVYVSPSGNDATADGTIAHPYQTLLAAATYNTGGFGKKTPADNVTIYLEQGDYAWPSAVWNENPSNSTGWLTVTAAPGVNPATARITSVVSGSSGFNTTLVHLENLTVGNGATGVILTANQNLSQSLWIDQVNWDGPGSSVNLNGMLYNGFNGGVYFTDVYSYNTSAHINATLVRNCEVNNAVCAYQNVGTIISSTASNIAPPSPKYHPDVLQYYETSANWGNVIIYGLTATMGTLNAQGIDLGPAGCLGVAIVNCNIVSTGAQTAFSAQTSATNLLILDSKFSGPISGWLANNNGTPFSAIDVVIEGTEFPNGAKLSLLGVTITP